MQLPMPRPSRLLAPLRYLPSAPLEVVIARVTSRLLAESLADGALEGLTGGALVVRMSDPEVELRFTLAGARVCPASSGDEPRVIVRAALEDLVLVLAQRTDPDTLFFQRRLRLEGDTALGLEVKNLLDAIDPAALPGPVQRVLDRAAASIIDDTNAGISSGYHA